MCVCVESVCVLMLDVRVCMLRVCVPVYVDVGCAYVESVCASVC